MHNVKLVGLSGLEPPTSPLSGVRSNQLSYKPISLLVLSLSSALQSSLTQSCMNHTLNRSLILRLDLRKITSK